MLSFKSSTMTRQVAQALGGLYVLYGLFTMKFSSLLFSCAVALIVLGLMGSMEIAVAVAIVVGLLFHVMPRRREGFSSQSLNPKNTSSSEGFQVTGANDVVKRLADIRAAAAPKASSPASGSITSSALAQGVLGSTFAEGFSDVTSSSSSSASGPEGEKKPDAPAAASSGPATASASTTASATTSGFTGSDGLFKLGEMPSEAQGGAHIDAGTTILNAIQGLKPDQIANMTDDTRKLLDTQKSLLGMLQNLKPMLADSQQLFSTFSGMFGQMPGAPAK